MSERDAMPARVRLDPDHNGWNEQVIGWADGNEVEDMTEWPVYHSDEAIRGRLRAYDAFAADVLMEMIRRLAKAAQKDQKARMDDLISAIHVLEAEFPEAKAELDRRHPTGAALQGETP